MNTTFYLINMNIIILILLLQANMTYFGTVLFLYILYLNFRIQSVLIVQTKNSKRLQYIIRRFLFSIGNFQNNSWYARSISQNE
jgi:hypothetical protein